METITLKEVLAYMDTAQEFSIAFITADKRKRKGGEWIVIPRGRKGVYDHHEPNEFAQNQLFFRARRIQITTIIAPEIFACQIVAFEKVYTPYQAV